MISVSKSKTKNDEVKNILKNCLNGLKKIWKGEKIWTIRIW
jgi:hypothetical protein